MTVNEPSSAGPDLLIAPGLIDCEALIAEARTFPPLPPSAVRMAALIGTHQYDVRDVADIVAYDPVLTLRLIRAANAAFQAGTVPVGTVHDAILRLGSAQTLALAIVGTARPLLQQPLTEYQLDEGQLWRHAVAAAVAVECLRPHCQSPIPAAAFTAALLHDIGKVVMSRFLPPEMFALIRRVEQEGGLGRLEAEIQVLDLHHGEIGGIVAQHWNMPEGIVKGIIYHHTPAEGHDPICQVVFCANRLAKQIEAKVAGRPVTVTLPDQTLSELGLAPNLVQRVFDQSVSRFDATCAQFNSR